MALNQATTPWYAPAFHAVNVGLHAVGSALFFMVLRKVGVAWPVAFLAALFFAVHPVHGEAVNQVVGRAELLVFVFFCFAAWAAFGEGWRHEVAACMFYLFALLSKEHAIVLPGLLLLFDAWRYRVAGRWPSQRWRLYLGLAAVTAAWIAYRSWAVQWGPVGDVADPIYKPLGEMSTGVRILSALRLQLVYLRNQILPFWLQGVYSGDWFARPVASLASPWGAAIVASMAVFAAGVWNGWRRREAYGLALSLYVVSFAVTANILFTTGATLADRLAYLPSAWVCLAVAWLFGGRRMIGVGYRWRSICLVSVCVVYAGSLVGVTLARNGFYRTPTALWSEDVRRDPGNVLAWLFLGDWLRASDDASGAEGAYRGMLEANPKFREGLSNYSGFLLAQGRVEEALVQASEALRQGVSAGARQQALLVLAEGNAVLQRPEEAMRWLEEVDGWYRESEDYLQVLGRVEEALGNLDAAAQSYRKIVHVDEAADRLVFVLLQLGAHEEARDLLLAEIPKRETPSLWNLLGVAYRFLGNGKGTLHAFSRAVELDPESQAYRENLARAMGEFGAIPKRSVPVAPERSRR
jgi:tetratricopeptide (TPR) repeat protein